jgi:hypothetical protein
LVTAAGGAEAGGTYLAVSGIVAFAVVGQLTSAVLSVQWEGSKTEGQGGDARGKVAKCFHNSIDGSYDYCIQNIGLAI